MTQTVSLLDGSVHPDEFSWRSAGDLPIGPRDANQPVVDPTKKPSRSVPPPKLPGAKGEFLTSSLEAQPGTKGNNEDQWSRTMRQRQDIYQEEQNIPVDPIEYQLGPKLPIQQEPNRGNIGAIPIIRHGETAENEKDIAHGWSNEPLTRRGLEQSEKAADALKGKEPTLIAYSDLKRSEQTASVIADKTGADKISIPELRTWDIGHFAGQKCGECEKELEPYVNNPDKRVPGGESFNDFRRRVFEGMQKALYAGADAIVTHNKTERLLAAAEGDGHPHENFSHKGGPGPGEMRRIQLAGDLVPGPWQGNPGRRYPLGTYGLEGIRGMRSGTIRGRSTNVDTSNVQELPGNMTPKQRQTDNILKERPMSDEDKYNKAVREQQMSRKSPMLRLINPEDEPEPKL